MYNPFEWDIKEPAMSVGVYILVELLNAVMAAIKIGLCGLALVPAAKLVMKKRGRK
jgi:hypothetical protein